MAEPIKKIRSPIRQQHAEQYLLITLLSFAASVSFTRLFLELTGYPQLGGGELHIAHVLWGGLLLFIAALLPLLFTNRWIYTLVSTLAGVGVGLFIDEVGKFITQTNDYFYPAAAPIVYVFFMLTVLVYVLIQKEKPENPRDNLYYIFRDLEEVLDHDLSPLEQAAIRARLKKVIAVDAHPDLTWLAKCLMDFLERDALYLSPEKPSLLQRGLQRWRQFEERFLSRTRLRAFLAGGLLAWGIWAISYPLRVWGSLRTPATFEAVMMRLISENYVRGTLGLNLFRVRIGLEGSVGLLLLFAAFLLATGRDRRAVMLSYAGLLITLTIVNPLLFYFEQFSTIFNAGIQTVLLLGTLYYRHRYLDQPRKQVELSDPPSTLESTS